MRNVAITALVLALAPNLAGALELKNVRPAYGPLGATRHDVKVLPGDIIFITYDIDGLTTDPKTGKASYVVTLELLDPQQKALFKKETPAEVLPQFGGGRMPGDLNVILGPKQAPGKYTIRLTVNDRHGKETKSFDYPFDVIPEAFGVVGVTAPALGFPGQPYLASFALVNMGLDSKKQPSIDVTLKVSDDSGIVVTRPILVTLPKDMPEGVDVTKENFVPINYPLFLNRPGRFTIDIVALDKTSNRQVQIRYPLQVIDVGAVAAGK